MPLYNLFEYSKSYSKTTGSLWNYYRDELTNETNGNDGLNKNVIKSKPFKYKTSIAVSTYPAGKYWSPGRPEDVPLQRPQNVP